MDEKEFLRLMSFTALAVKKWAPDFSDVNTMRIWYASLKGVDPDKLRSACRIARETMDEFPTIAKIIRLSNGVFLSDEEVGRDLAVRIEEAIGRFGYTNPGSAETFIGELGWEVVKQSGGWSSVCSITEDHLASSRKHWRETGALVSKKFHTLGKITAPALTSGNAGAPSHALLQAFNLATKGIHDGSKFAE